MNGVFANYVLKRIWPKGVNADTYFESCDFSREKSHDSKYVSALTLLGQIRFRT